mgnify:CR=1 FL=1
MGYVFLFVIVFVAMAVVLVGDLLALGVLVWGSIHLFRRRPGWYISKILKAGCIGGAIGTGLAVGLSLLGDSLSSEDILGVAQLAFAGFGWASFAPARCYREYRFETVGPPL